MTAIEPLHSLLSLAWCRKIGVLVLPTLAALLIVCSGRSLDVQATAHEALRVLGFPGHGVIDDIIGWVHSPDRVLLIVVLSSAAGFFFAMSDGRARWLRGNEPGIAWVLMLPVVAAEGSAALVPIVNAFVLTLLVGVGLALVDRTPGEFGLAQRFDLRDLGLMALKSVGRATMVPFLPLVILYQYVVESVTWPDLAFDDETIGQAAGGERGGRQRRLAPRSYDRQ
jgi:hypothetical protein